MSGRLQPVLEDFDIDSIAGIARVRGPDLTLEKTHAVQRLFRQARAGVSQFLGIAICTAQALDHAALAADVIGGAHVADRIGGPHRDTVTAVELWRYPFSGRHRYG